MDPRWERWAPWIASAAVAAGMLALRAPSLEDLDGANFALGMSDYDLGADQPHFPGYPLYLALAWPVFQLTGDAVLALQVPGPLAWAAGLALFQLAMGRHYGQRTGWTAWALLALCPLGWLLGGRASSDALGAGLGLAAWSAGALASHHEGSRQWLGAAGVLAALTLGARMALLPWILPLLVLLTARRGRLDALVGFAAGAGAWLVPFLVFVGPDVWRTGLGYLVGHFTRWGGSLLSVDAASAPERLMTWIQGLGAWGLGTPMPADPDPWRWAVALFWLGAWTLGLRKLPRPGITWLLVAFGPYLLWLVIGQSPDEPRHLIALLPVLAALGGLGLATVDRRVVALGFFALGVVCLRTAALHHQVASPQAQLSLWLHAEHPSNSVRLFTGDSGRALSVLNPELRPSTVLDTQTRDRMLATEPTPTLLLWTDELDDPERAPPGYAPAEVVAHFARDPRVHAGRSELRVFTAERQAP